MTPTIPALIARVLGLEAEPAPSANLEALGCDELDLAELAIDIEHTFGIWLPGGAEDVWRTVEDVERSVEEAKEWNAS